MIQEPKENDKDLNISFLAYIKSSSMDDEGEKKLTLMISSKYLKEIQELERHPREVLKFYVQKHQIDQ